MCQLMFSLLSLLRRYIYFQVSTWFANARRRLKKENKMTWEPKNKLDDEDVDVSDDDDKDRDDEKNGKKNENEKKIYLSMALPVHIGVNMLHEAYFERILKN